MDDRTPGGYGWRITEDSLSLGHEAMSVLPVSPESGRVEHPIRAVVRDGEIVRIKFCPSCGRDKLVSEVSRESEFPRNGLRRDGRVSGFKPVCKVCYARVTKARRDNNIEAHRAADRANYRRRMKDPEYAAFLSDYWRTYQQERRDTDPDFVAAANARSKRWRARKVAEDPTYFSYRRELERRRARQQRRLDARSVVDDNSPRIPVGPFRDWLLAQQARTNNLEGLTGMNQRRLWSVLNHEFPRISIDIVDRAIFRAPPVYVHGELVLTLNDLYPL